MSNRIMEFRKEPHLSASAIAEYMECGLAYRFSRIDKLRPEFRPDSMEFGSCIHQTLADFHQDRMTGHIMTVDDLENRFEHHWTLRAGNNEDIHYKPDNSFEKMLEEGKGLIRTYYENFKDQNLTVLAIEEPFRFTIDRLPIPVIGVMDLVEEDEQGSVIITDFKTSAKSYNEDDVSRNFQLTLYHMNCRNNGFRDRNIVMKINCLVRTKTPQFKQYYTARTRIDEFRAAKKIQEVWKGISRGIFIPNDESWKCKDCVYKIACNDWYAV